MSDVLFEALDDCLRAVEAGASPEAALARYPDLADELRPLLTAAAAARPVEPLRVPRQSEAASRARFLARARVLAGERRQAAGLFGSLSLTLRMGLAVLAVALVSGLGAAGLVSASAQSLPGDTLYGVKRAAEQAQLAFTAGPARAALEDAFDQRRLAEAEAVAALGRTVAVEFVGRVAAQAGERWTIAGLTVLVPAGLGQGVAVGQTVAVAGQVQADGSILAERITPRGAATATARPGPSQTPTQTAARTETAEPSATPEAEDTRPSTVTQSAAPTGTPTHAVTPRPTQASGSASPTKVEPSHTPKPAEGNATPTATAKSGSSGPAPSNTPKPAETRLPSATPHDDDQTPEATHTPDAGGDPEPQPSDAPDDDPIKTPEASQTPQPESVDFEGQVEAVGEVWVVSGESVIITGATEFRDSPQLGDRVKVAGWRYWDGRLVARRIEKD